MTDKVSIIIITRNRAKMLARCLNSLVKQTQMADEVVVVDNASTDNTKEVIANYAISPRRWRDNDLDSFEVDNGTKLPIKYVLEKQIGMPYARNTGLQASRGDLILMLDDDCEADRLWVERMAAAHGKHPKAWVIQGRTFSAPKTLLYSLLAEFHRFSHLNASVKKNPLKMENFFDKEFKEEIEVLVCNPQNFSIKKSYFEKQKLSFDERFYRGADTDLSKQIVQKKGLIMFCPKVIVYHYERSTLAQFLKQRWEFGRTAARIEDKWKIPPKKNEITIIPRPKTLLNLSLFCKISYQLHKLPALIALLIIESLYRLNGYFYEKRALSLAKQ